MANTGYITSSGIQQVFTTGPYSGSLVTSSYASGNTLFGYTIDFNQYFTSGTLDYLLPCPGLSYYRYYEDLITCPINGCSPPILISSQPFSCNPYSGNYTVLYNSSSVSASYTIINYSTDQTFLTNTGSQIYVNSNPLHLLLDTSTLPLQPTAFTTVYFQAYNSCSSGTTSSLSNIVSASCSTPIDDELGPIIEPFSIYLENNLGQTLYYIKEGSTQFALLNGANTTFTFTASTYNLEFSTLFGIHSLSTEVNVNINKSGFSDGQVSITATDVNGTNNPININTYPNNYTFTPDAYNSISDLILDIDKSSYYYGGTLSLIFTPSST